jgi:hypothetical protein
MPKCVDIKAVFALCHNPSLNFYFHKTPDDIYGMRII